MVSSDADSGPGTLRQAIVDSNASGGDDTIEITVSGTIVLSSSLPLITDNTVLNGPGDGQLTISGNNMVQVFATKSGTTNVFKGLSISFGLATNNAHGAAISNAADLTLLNCAVVDNHTFSGLGGGIYNSGNLTLVNSSIASNSVTGGDGYGSGAGGQGGGGGGLGGGLFSTSGTVVISNCTFVSNRATGGNGGGGGASDQTGANGGGPNGGMGGQPDGDGGAGGFGGGGGGGGTRVNGIGGNGGAGGFGGGGGGGGLGGAFPWASGGVGGFGGGNGGGASTQSGLLFVGNGGGGAGMGGAIFVDGGSAVLQKVSLAENQSVGGNSGTVDVGLAEGGSGFGGGFFAKGAVVKIGECFTYSNQSTGGFGISYGHGGQSGGAGLYLLNSTLELLGSTLASNRVVGGASGIARAAQPGGDGNGGGLVMSNGVATITNCTFSGNQSMGGRGGTGYFNGPAAGGAAFGGGVFVGSATATLVNCTIFGNAVTGGPGGSFTSVPTGDAHGGGFSIRSGTLSLLNTLIGSNTATTNSSPSDGSGAVTSQGHNLISYTNEISGLIASDLKNISANVGPLQNNGGFPPTHALLLNSPALDGGDSNGAPPTDERGVTRPQGNGVDIGAFELPPVSILLNGLFIVGPATNFGSVQVSFQTTFTNGTMLYTLDGSTPSPNSTLYTGPLTLTNSATIRVIAYSADFSQSSEAGPIEVVVVPLYSLAIATVGQGTVTTNPSPGPYPSNTVVALTATPATNWIFVGWTGDATGANPTINITMNRNKGVQAEFIEVPVYALTVTIAGNGSVSLNPPGGSYPSNTFVMLTANPDSGWVFSGWRGDITSADLTIGLTMDRSKQVTAEFAPTYSLSVGTEGGGTFMMSPPSGPYPSNSIVTLTAIPATGWMFQYWLGDVIGTNPTENVQMTGDKCIRGIFGTSLGTTAAGNGSVTVSPSSPLYSYGNLVRLTAIPFAGNYFALWGNAASGTNSPLVFSITNANPTVSALFATLPAGQFSLAVIPDGLGKVIVTPQANRFNNGQAVTLTAMPESGQQFVSWSGDATGATNPLLVTMNTNKVITAGFTKRPVLSAPECFGYLENGSFRLLLRGEVGRYSIEKSSDLLQWASVLTVSNGQGVIQIDTPPGTNAQSGFYRAVVVPGQ